MSSRANLSDACLDGEHDPTWDREAGMTVCRKCGLPGAQIVKNLGHDLY